MDETSPVDDVKIVTGLIDRARRAQTLFAAYDQDRVDRAVRAIGKAVFDHAEAISRLAVEETGMGRYEDKLAKNTGKAKAIWASLKGKKSRGVVRRLDDEGIVEVAKPMGVIGAVCPVTNPTATPMHNAMIALKGGNAIIICPHPRARRCGKLVVEVMNRALAGLGAPENLIQIIEEPTLRLSTLVMQLTDVCISTGGPAMVKAAYTSGKPAFGVGPGNVQCLVDRGVDTSDVVSKVIRGRTYDNGILCTCDQSVICPAENLAEVVAAFSANGGHVVTDGADIDTLRRTLFPDGSLNKDLVGAAPEAIAAAAGLTVRSDTRLIAVVLAKHGADELFAKEKLCPVLGIFSYETWDDAIAIAMANLEVEGKGHSVVIHSHDREHIEYAAERIPVSRVAVNQSGSNSLGGTFVNGLNPTLTLGCGSWGNNSISENLWYTHLINISRIAYVKPAATVPGDDEVWGDD